MKMQSLYFTKNGNAQKVADFISRDIKCKCDQIPPAYPCEKEMLVCISFESGKIDKKLMDFCKTMTPERAQHVVFAVIGPDNTGLDELKSVIQGNKIHVMEKTLECRVKKGLFGQGKLSDNDAQAAIPWIHSIIKELGE